MKRVLIAVAVVAMLGGWTARAEAAAISLFFNGSYVDTGTEGANLRATLVGLGHTVTNFVGITAADWTAAGAGGALIFLPEMELDNLFDDLDAAAKAALTGYVSGGGGLLQANAYPDNSNLANGLFGYSLTQSGNIGDTNLNAGAAAGTSFAGGPATLPGANAVEGMSSASLPGGALNLYSAGGNTSVFATTFGAGHYVYLGYDWFGGEDADWTDVTQRAIEYSSNGVVPEPASLLLLGTGILVSARRLRRARR